MHVLGTQVQYKYNKYSVMNVEYSESTVLRCANENQQSPIDIIDWIRAFKCGTISTLGTYKELTKWAAKVSIQSFNLTLFQTLTTYNFASSRKM